MITIQSADNILKSVYLDAISDLLNTKTNPLLAKIEKTSNYVSGKEIRKALKLSIDGGIGAGDETGDLPSSSPSLYAQAVMPLKNLYGQIEISDKVLRAGSDEKGAFTNILNNSLEGLLEASRFNLSRMLYGDSTGLVAKGVQNGAAGTLSVISNMGVLIEGMVVDIYDDTDTMVYSKVGIKNIDRRAKTIDFYDSSITLDTASFVYASGSRDKELTGLGAIFDTTKSIYGLDRSIYKVLNPYLDPAGDAVSDIAFQKAIDTVESYTNGSIDYIACANDVKLAYQAYLSTYKRNVDVLELAGGYKTISYNGIPIVGERFIDNGIAYMLDSKAFKMNQLCDWQFIEGDSGRVLRQTQGKPTYTATLVKYCDIMCERPNAQAKLILDTTI
ncbi:MAG: phage major capsid protein [Firmicutes bacterium]|nr:phage major capsid protein [Bacillota bacterium]